MIGLFANPGFLIVAAALVSVPIIIHLINRMRFKRIRWAAMEFLLKAQKRTRRRLIIEQLLLLALRCLLIFLVGCVLVTHFVEPAGALLRPGIVARVLAKWLRTRLRFKRTLLERNFRAGQAGEWDAPLP